MKNELTSSTTCPHIKAEGKKGVCPECQLQMKETKEKMNDCSIF